MSRHKVARQRCLNVRVFCRGCVFRSNRPSHEGWTFIIILLLCFGVLTEYILHPILYPRPIHLAVFNSGVSLDREALRQIEAKAVAEYHIPSFTLVENAGRGVSDTLLHLGVKGNVLVLAGGGTKAAQGMAAARHLFTKLYDDDGVHVDVILCEPEDALSTEAKEHLRALTAVLADYQAYLARDPSLTERDKLVISTMSATPSVEDYNRLKTKLAAAEWIVDALLGPGSVGPLQQPLEKIIKLANSAGATNTNLNDDGLLYRRLSVDVPSGFDCETGKPVAGSFHSDHTVTFHALRPGFMKYQALMANRPRAANLLGRVHVVDLGFPWWFGAPSNQLTPRIPPSTS